MAEGRIFIHPMSSMRDLCKRTLLLREMNYFLLTLMTYKSLKHSGIWNSPAICKNNISIGYLPLHHDADCLCSNFNLFSNIRVNGFQKFLLCLLEKKIQTYHIQWTYKMYDLVLDKLSKCLLLFGKCNVCHSSHLFHQYTPSDLIEANDCSKDQGITCLFQYSVSVICFSWIWNHITRGSGSKISRQHNRCIFKGWDVQEEFCTTGGCVHIQGWCTFFPNIFLDIPTREDGPLHCLEMLGTNYLLMWSHIPQ